MNKPLTRTERLQFLPNDDQANARWVYRCLEDHYFSHERCAQCKREGNTLHITGDAPAHIAALAGAQTMDLAGIILQLRKELIQYLPTRDVTIVTFVQLERREAVA